MLVLSRRKGEKIVIGNAIVIEILTVSGDGVRIGITAPGETSIHRHEVFTEIQEANRNAETVLGELEKTSLEQLAAFLRVNQK